MKALFNKYNVYIPTIYDQYDEQLTKEEFINKMNPIEHMINICETILKEEEFIDEGLKEDIEWFLLLSKQGYYFALDEW